MGHARIWTAVVVLALATTACSRSGSSKGSTTPSTGTRNAAAGDFGDQQGVCGPGTAKGATEQGVTDSTITVGTMADPGTTIQPGLDQEIFDTADAFVAWCNAAGGIAGRKLAVEKWDSKLTEVAARMLDACRSDFMLVGNLEALDAAGVGPRTKCKLGEISTGAVSNDAGTAPMSVEAIPVSNHQSVLGGPLRVLKQEDPAAAAHLGQLSSQVQSIKDAGNRDRAAAKQLGYTEAYYDELPLTVDAWRPYAQNLQTRGVQVFITESSPDNLANLYRAASDLGSFPKHGVFTSNMYDPKLVQNGGTALDGHDLRVALSSVPFELASTHPAVKQYLDVLTKYGKGAKPKALGVRAWSAWMLFAESAKACGSQLTRTCVLGKAGAVKGWTAGGLHAPVDPGNANSPNSPCFVFVRATSKGFVVDEAATKPTDGIFNCDPANSFDLPGFPTK